MQKTRLEDLNLLDDFMFGTMVSHPRFGEQFTRAILQIILNRKIGKVTVTPQKNYLGTNTDKHGIRLDVFIEEKTDTDAGETNLYDIEPDKNDKKELKEALPKRVRFYHAKIDSHSLESGVDYRQLKRVIVILIMPYDPFHLNRMVYTIKNCCMEEPDMLYEDGARTIFLYTKGEEGNPPEELQKLLHYFQDSREENADDALVHNIHEMVQNVRHEKEVSLKFMKVFEREQMIHDEGVEEGKKEGRAEIIQIVRKKLHKDMQVSEIADLLELEEAYIVELADLIKKYPQDTDIELAEKYIYRHE